MKRPINNSFRIRAALALGAFTAEQLARMLTIHARTAHTVLFALRRDGLVQWTRRRDEVKVWGLA